MSIRRSLCVAVFALALAAPAFAQQPVKRPDPQATGPVPTR